MDEQLSIPAEEATNTPSDIDRVRELILASHPDIVPELVQGESVSDLVASIGSAREAYTRIAESVPTPTPVTIPAGGNTPVTIDVDSLPTSEKLRRGLAASNRS